MSKTIQERAKEYAPDVVIGRDYAEVYTESEIAEYERAAFIAGALSEHEELTKWNISQEYPELNKEVLIRYKLNKDGKKFIYTTGYVSKDESSGEIVWNSSDDSLPFDLDFFWTEIYE